MTDEKQVRQLNLTDAQFEHTLGIIGEIDLTPLLAAFGDGGRMVDLVAAIPMLGQVREKRIMRRLEAVWSADADTLELAEADSVLMAKLESQASRKPVKDTLEGFLAFFAGLGLSQDATPGSSALATLTTRLERVNPSDQAQPGVPGHSVVL